MPVQNGQTLKILIWTGKQPQSEEKNNLCYSALKQQITNPIELSILIYSQKGCNRTTFKGNTFRDIKVDNRPRPQKHWTL